MTAKKKPSKKPTKPKRTARKKATPAKAPKRSKKVAKKKPAPKRKEKKKVAAAKQPRKSQRVGEAFAPDRRGPRSGEQSGDLQGLSRREGADSESVDELIEEGNAFEADAVAGVESADDADEKEVHTHEVPEDDVPGEYLDEE